VPAGWNLGGIEPEKVTVTEGTPEEVQVTVTNVRELGSVTVKKSLVGDPTGASTEFTVNLDCSPGDAYDHVGIKLNSANSWTATFANIPSGVTCQVTEPAAGIPDGWALVSVTPSTAVAVQANQTITFTVTNRRLGGKLNIVKQVSPVAGNGTVVEFGDTLTYTLTVSADGEQRQPNVIVTDYVPGYDPARPKSGKTTYLKGSAACIGAGTCTVTEPGADHLITWKLGDMAAGTTRQVTFKVTIDDVEGDPGETVAVDILNAGAVQSDRTPKTPSNQVITPVTKVFPIKAVKPPKVLPHTGSVIEPGPLAAGALTLLGLGLFLMASSRRRTRGAHRA